MLVWRPNRRTFQYRQTRVEKQAIPTHDKSNGSGLHTTLTTDKSPDLTAGIETRSLFPQSGRLMLYKVFAPIVPHNVMLLMAFEGIVRHASPVRIQGDSH